MQGILELVWRWWNSWVWSLHSGGGGCLRPCTLCKIFQFFIEFSLFFTHGTKNIPQQSFYQLKHSNSLLSCFRKFCSLLMRSPLMHPQFFPVLTCCVKCLTCHQEPTCLCLSNLIKPYQTYPQQEILWRTLNGPEWTSLPGYIKYIYSLYLQACCERTLTWRSSNNMEMTAANSECLKKILQRILRLTPLQLHHQTDKCLSTGKQ